MFYSSFLPVMQLPPASDQDLWSRQLVQRPTSLGLPFPPNGGPRHEPWMDMFAMYPYSAIPFNIKPSPTSYSPQEPDSGYSTAVVTPETPPPPGFPPMVSIADTAEETMRICEAERIYKQVCHKLRPFADNCGQDNAEVKPEVQGPASAAAPLPQSLVTPPNPDCSNFVGQQVTFWVENQGDLSFEVTIHGPDGRVDCSTFLDLTLDKFSVCFTPVIPGNYKVQVSYLSAEEMERSQSWVSTPPPPTEPEPISFQLDGRGIHIGKERVHLPGSPFNIPVRRNYYLSSLNRPFVHVDMELDTYHINQNLPEQMRVNEVDLVVSRKPWGLAINPITQMMYVTDREQHQVLVYSHDGTPAFAFGTHGRNTGEFRRPCGIAFDVVLDRLYVTDKDNHRIQVFNSVGVFLFTFGMRGRKSGQFAFPWGIDVNRVGTLIVVADSRNHRLQIFDEHGTFLRKIADRGVFFDYPRGVAFDPSGQYVFSTDFNLHHVLCTDVEFKHRCRVVVNMDHLNRPQSVHVDTTGQLFVTSASDSNIKVFDAWTGNPLYEIASIGGSRTDLTLNAVSLHGGYLAILEMTGKINII